jgi:Uma2 family endonuclease
VTSKEVLLEPEERRLEVIDGVAEEKAAPGFNHALVVNQLGGIVGQAFGRKGRGGPGGWWITNDPDIELSSLDLVRPDVAGWRRERMPERPVVRPVTVAPDWICEILSPSNRKRDLVDKHNLYHRHGVSHYWQVDPEAQTLTVLGHEPDGYKVLLVASGLQPVRAAPFEQLEFSVAELLGEEPPG